MAARGREIKIGGVDAGMRDAVQALRMSRLSSGFEVALRNIPPQKLKAVLGNGIGPEALSGLDRALKSVSLDKMALCLVGSASLALESTALRALGKRLAQQRLSLAYPNAIRLANTHGIHESLVEALRKVEGIGIPRDILRQMDFTRAVNALTGPAGGRGSHTGLQQDLSRFFQLRSPNSNVEAAYRGLLSTWPDGGGADSPEDTVERSIETVAGSLRKTEVSILNLDLLLNFIE